MYPSSLKSIFRTSALPSSKLSSQAGSLSATGVRVFPPPPLVEVLTSRGRSAPGQAEDAHRWPGLRVHDGKGNSLTSGGHFCWPASLAPCKHNFSPTHLSSYCSPSLPTQAFFFSFPTIDKLYTYLVIYLLQCCCLCMWGTSGTGRERGE